MNFLVLTNTKLNLFFENIKSENLGFYFSFLLHLIIILLAVGLPNFFDSKKINLPNIIPIEIINITDVTSTNKIKKEVETGKIKKSQIKEKKFNSSNNQEIKKIEIKEKKILDKNELTKNISIKENILIKEKKDISVEIENKKIDLVEKNIESIPNKKIKPKLKPKPNINQKVNKSDLIIKKKPKKLSEEFNIASMLKDLRNDKTILKKDNTEEIKKKDKIDQDTPENEEELAQLSISEIDILRQQLSSCWNAPAGAVIEKGMLVKISARVKQNKTIFDNTVRIVDTNIPKSNSFYGPITESAMRTLLNPDCIPLKLPKDKYSLWKNLTITFDYSIMKGY